jgi:protein-disulfide isomerase
VGRPVEDGPRDAPVAPIGDEDMRQFAAAALVLVALCGTGGRSARADEFTPGQRAEIVAVVRDALVKDPTILRDAVNAMQVQGVREAEEEASKHIGENRSALFAAADGASAGNPSGDVTLVEFYDPRCPYCRKMSPIIAELLKSDRGLRVVYKDIPVLGPASEIETRAILAAGLQGGYGKMQDALMSDPAQPKPEMIRAAAVKSGVDADRLIKDMSSAAVVDVMKANLALSKAMKVQGTPVFIVGDRVMTGAADLDTLKVAISAARKAR